VIRSRKKTELWIQKWFCYHNNISIQNNV